MNSSLLYYSFYFPRENKKRKQFPVLKFAIALTMVILLLIAYRANSQSLPTGFNQVLVANGISNPTVMAFAPDGRIFVAQQTGELRIIKNGALLSQPFITLSVNSSGERGLLGIAFDPAFTTNHYIYLYYTLSSASNNRISRFTANNDLVVAGSEVVLLDLDPLSSATNHNGGTMQFGPDGKLYVGVGENANTANAQNLNTYLGKILRINSDGSVPSGNPYTSGSNQMKRIWSYGLRNPFTIAFQPGIGRLFVNDVGQSAWEEIDEATASGLNFGWPATEGNSSTSGYTNPIYTYAHGSASGQGCAITGGTFFNPSSTSYPSSYIGKYFYIDYCGDWIDVLTLNGTSATRANFATGISGSPVSLVTGNDGNLYYLSRDNSSVYKITYTTVQSPVITNQPQSLTVAQGNSATFNVSVSGTAPFSYQWRKNGNNITGANSNNYTISSVASSDAGNYSVVVNNSAGSTISNNASLTVTGINVTLNPVADAQVRDGSFANTNYGSAKNVSTKNTSSANERYQTYLRFDISSLSANQTSVKLRLYGHINNSNITSITSQVYNVASQTWGETTITYNNKPSAQATILANATITGTTSQYYEWDLTSFINSQRSAGITTVSLLLDNSTVSNKSRLIFNSKECASQKPQLKCVAPSPRIAASEEEQQKEIKNDKTFSFTVYPNPVKDVLKIEFSEELINGNLQVFDMLGKNVLELRITQSTEAKINVNDLQNGIYILVINNENKKSSQRIMIRK